MIIDTNQLLLALGVFLGILLVLTAYHMATKKSTTSTPQVPAPAPALPTNTHTPPEYPRILASLPIAPPTQAEVKVAKPQMVVPTQAHAADQPHEISSAHVKAAADIAVVAKQLHTPDAPAHVQEAATTLSKVAQRLAVVGLQHAEDSAPNSPHRDL